MGLDGRLVHIRTPLLMSAWDGVTILWLNALNDLRVVFTLYFLTQPDFGVVLEPHLVAMDEQKCT